MPRSRRSARWAARGGASSRSSRASSRSRSRPAPSARPRPSSNGCGRSGPPSGRMSRLRLDVNGAWDLATARSGSRPIARFDIEFVEQPLAAHDIDGMAELRRRVRVPIAADEAAASVRDVRALLEADAVDVIVVKPARVGGPGAVAEIAALAAAHGVPVVISTLFETGIGIAAALAMAATLPGSTSARWPAPLDHGLATAGLLEHDLLAGSLLVEEGRMRAPVAAGSGGLGSSWMREPSNGSGSTRSGRRHDAGVLRSRLARGRRRRAWPRTPMRAPGDWRSATGRSRWTWASWIARADAVARLARPRRVEPGDRVALLAAPSAAAVAALHGIARVGAVAAPLGPGLTAEPSWPRRARSSPADRDRRTGLEGRRALLGGPMPRSTSWSAGRDGHARTCADRGPSPDPAAPAVGDPDVGDDRPPEGRRAVDGRARRQRRGWLAALPRRPAGCWRSGSATSPGSASSGGRPCRACPSSCWIDRTPRRSSPRWAPTPRRATSRSCRRSDPSP